MGKQQSASGCINEAEQAVVSISRRQSRRAWCQKFWPIATSPAHLTACEIYTAIRKGRRTSRRWSRKAWYRRSWLTATGTAAAPSGAPLPCGPLCGPRAAPAAPDTDVISMEKEDKHQATPAAAPTAARLLSCSFVRPAHGTCRRTARSIVKVSQKSGVFRVRQQPAPGAAALP